MKNNNLRSWLSPQIGLLLVFILAIFAAKWRFWPWTPDVFFGDDLSNLLQYKTGQFASSIGQALASANSEKFRPIFASAMWLLFNAFEQHILPYMVTNVLLHGLNATLVFIIAYRLSRANALVSLSITLAIATSRFALYQVTQVTGLIEGLALLFFLATIYCLVRADQQQKNTFRWGWLAAIAAFLAIHTHERYIVLLIWLFLALTLLPSFRTLSRVRWLTLFSVITSILIFNVLYKVAILHLPFFVGTGGTHMSIDAGRSLYLLAQAALSIFGFNMGPNYLAGKMIITMSWPPWVLAIIFSLTWLYVIVMSLRPTITYTVDSFAHKFQQLHWPFLLSALVVLLLLPPIMTIRVEQRWLLEPFILMLLLFAWAINRLRTQVSSSRLVPASGLLIVVTSIAIDSIIAPHFKNIFFVSSGQYAATVNRYILDKKFDGAKTIGLIASEDHCNWTLLKDGFFRLYGNSYQAVHCFPTFNHSLSAVLPDDAKIYSKDSAQSHLIDITTEWQQHIQARSSKVIFDFIKAFSDGHINNPIKVLTPSGTGAISMPQQTIVGTQNALIVISNFSYRYDNIFLDHDAQLRFNVGMIHPSKNQARAIVRIDQGPGISQIVYAQDLIPPTEGEILHFKPVAIPLSEYTGKNISVTFATETAPGKDGSGHWIGFANPQVILDTNFGTSLGTTADAKAVTK